MDTQVIYKLRPDLFIARYELFGSGDKKKLCNSVRDFEDLVQARTSRHVHDTDDAWHMPEGIWVLPVWFSKDVETAHAYTGIDLVDLFTWIHA